jgi:hypothetical protein
MPPVSSGPSAPSDPDIHTSAELIQKVELNDIFKEVMKKYHTIRQSPNLIVRCENLPVVEGINNILLKIFANLIGIIINSFDQPSKLFLYIDCKEETTNKTKQYTIKFNANIPAREHWLEKHQAVLTGCEKKLSVYGGCLTVNYGGVPGCLFSIMLPAKFG